MESLAKEAIVDTNGAGDTFVGCIQRSGCTMPDICDFKVGHEMWDCLPRVLTHSCQPGHQVYAGGGGGGGAQAGQCHVEGGEDVRGCGDVGLSSTCPPPLPI